MDFNKKFNIEPEFKTKREAMFNIITEIDNDYLQAWVDAGAYVMFTGKEDFWIMTNFGQLLFRIRENHMHLECISVHADDRRQGNGSKLMKHAVDFADETGTTLTLEVANVTGNGYNMSQHPVISAGMTKKNKIPVKDLPKWYMGFGFRKHFNYTAKKKSMIYSPEKK